MNKRIFSPAPEGSEALILSSFSDKNIIFVANNDREMARIKSCLEFFCPERNVLEFPAWDTMPYDRTSPSIDISSKRISTLSELTRIKNSDVSRETFVILTTVNAVSQKLPPLEHFSSESLIIREGDSFSRNYIIKFLAGQGYDRVSKVMETGEFAVRGDIIDVFPSGSDEAIRIDLFGDNVEKLKTFEPLSQISSGTCEKLEVLPANEVILDETTIEVFKKNYRSLFGISDNEDGLYQNITSGMKISGIENWLPLFYDGLSSLYEYVSRETLVILAKNSIQSHEERKELVQDYYAARAASANNYNPVPISELYLDSIEPENLQIAELSDFDNKDAINLGYRKSLFTGEGIEKIDSIKKPTLIACYSQGSTQHIIKLIKSKGYKAEELLNWKSANVSRETIQVFNAPIEVSFETNDFTIITEHDILGDRFIRTAKKKRKVTNFFEEAASFAIDEIIVHQEHGVGKFSGLEILNIGNVKHEMVKLLFADDDKLFVPVENIDLITKYGSNNSETKLDRLGGNNWSDKTKKLKEKIKFAAEQLLRIAADRAYKKADIIETEEGLYNEFCASFPHVETEDQLSAIEDVMADLKSGVPMDRLVCGDVGFGKTEVAMRAAFAVAASGKQVALICPTTILARQHYNSFKERFKGIPIEISQISRMVSANVSRETSKKLAEGKVDIVIGTHALLADNIKFKNLGLIIVDEEQNFGVKQKEKLKEIKTNAHILSLSATPIPRSLQLSISGIRDLSIIATPPIDRLAIRSFVSIYDEVTISEAISRERNRGGQIFYVAPRVSDLKDIYLNLKKIAPEIKIAQAHGQMKPNDLDDIMNQFYDGKFDILLSTTIIESGLDVKNANTLIIHKADMFGLAQLYQLRGRVGRSKQRGYAYFTLPKNRKLTKDAYKRLEVMRSIDSLGAGFSIASHDMDIRGFGNLLGEEQSGHVKEIGIELYQKMLNEAVIRAKAEGEIKEEFTVNINLGMNVLLPEEYITDLDIRIELYKRAAILRNNDEVDALYVEIIDRFGKPPEEVLFLLDTIRLKILCRRIGINKIDSGPKAVVMSFIDEPYVNSNDLFEYVRSNADKLKIKPDNKLVFRNVANTQEELLENIFFDLNNLLGLCEESKEQAA